jgi:hypothetical protein
MLEINDMIAMGFKAVDDCLVAARSIMLAGKIIGIMKYMISPAVGLKVVRAYGATL